MALFEERLLKARRMRGMRQIDLARVTGLGSTHIAHFEAGTRKPSFKNFERLADALNVSFDYLRGVTAEVNGEVSKRIANKIDSLNYNHQQIAEMFVDGLIEMEKNANGQIAN